MRYRSLVELAPMAIAVQVEGKIRFANSSMLVLLGLFDNPQIIGRSIIEFMDEATRGECAAAIEEIERRGGRLNGVKCNFRRADGSIVNADAACACVLYNGEIGVQLAIQDVTERARLEIELRDLSTRDALTGLANRRLFDETVRRECRRASRGGAPIALIMIDIDYFKKYNDNYGHLGGDDVIQRVAGALASNVHRAGDLLARYGGEEFVVILTETGPEGAMILGERLRAAVEALQIPHAYSAAAPHVTISVGIATSFAETRPNAETLIARADQALYASKAAGRNQVTLAEGESRTTPSGA